MHRVADGFLRTAICAGLALTTELRAQDTTARVSTSDSIRPPVGPCWRGRPKPKCEWFAITEVGYFRPFATTRTTTFYGGSAPGQVFQFTDNDFASQLSWEVGAMKNRGAKSALGATLLLGVGDASTRIGVKGRYRRWLNPEGLALDVSAGALSGRALNTTGNSLIVTGDAAFNYFDYGAIVARAEVTRANDAPRAAVYGGIRFGSKPAAIATVVMAGLFAILAAAFANSDF
jgi:hypothetical protein